MFIGNFKKSVIVTYIGIVSTMVGIYLAFNSYIIGAIIALMISGICDMFDGKVARMCKNRTNDDIEYGIQIDSLADMISFIAFPIVIAYTMGLNDWYYVIFYSLFTICGITRLAYFNLTTNNSGPVKYYSGMPVTATAIIFPSLYMLKYITCNYVFNGIFGCSFLLIAFLFIANFKIKKITENWWYILLCSLAIITTIILLYLRFLA
jgi:CDP-diacylglycerol--serine O-phosphatidyltransferase